MSTAAVTANNAGWTDLGTGPMAVIANSGPVSLLIYSGTTFPGADADAVPVDLERGIPMNYNFSDKLWIKGPSATNVTLKVIK